MAVYKVIQDIEAEDKLLGPLTLKGFIYALIAGFSAFITFKLAVSADLGNVRWAIIGLVFAPIMILFGVLASPLGRDQPTEVWLLAHIRFFLKTRLRIWNPSEANELVTITAPKKVEVDLTKGLSSTEVQSRLKTLAMTMDSHGWAVKNVNLNLQAPPAKVPQEPPDDRLVSMADVTKQAPVVDIHASDDIMDEKNNPLAQKFAKLIHFKDGERKKANIEKVVKMAKTGQGVPTKHHKKMGKSSYDIPEDEDVLNAKLKQASAAFRKEHPGKRAESQKLKAKSTRSKGVTAAQQAVNMNLAQSGNDLSVASIQHLAKRGPAVNKLGSNEVEISLH